MISQQEHEAWDVLLACQGQLRLAPSGHVIGIDMGTALRLGAARGYDLAVLSELLPAAEAGLVEALCSDQVLDDKDLDHVDDFPHRPNYGNIGVQTSLPRLTHRHSDGQLWVRKFSFCLPKAEGHTLRAI